MVDVQTIGILIASASVVVAAISFIQQNREAKRMRQTELFTSLFSGMREDDFTLKFLNIMNNWDWKDYDEFMEKYGWTTNLETHAQWISISQYLYNFGLFISLKQLDPVYAYEGLRVMVIQWWEFHLGFLR